MSWWDGFYSFTNAIDEKLWYIKYQLEDWVKNIADMAVANARDWFDILAHSWDDVKNYAVAAAASAYELLEVKINDVRDYADTKANQAYNNAILKLDGMKDYAKGKANDAYDKAYAKIGDVYTHINEVRGTLNTKIEMLETKINAVQGTAATAAKSYTDGVKKDLLASMSGMESVAGAARAALVNRIDGAIEQVELETLKARNAIVSSLKKTISDLDTKSKAARDLLDKSLKSGIATVEKKSKDARVALEKVMNNGMDKLEKEAKEAREVIEGTLIQMIEAAEDVFDRAMADLEKTFKGLLAVLGVRVGVLEGWVNNAASWFDKELNKYKGRVITWIVDGFEGILDRVFK